MIKNPFVIAIVGAALLTFQQLQLTHTTDWKVIGMAVLIAVLGAVATQLKGKGPSLLGIIGSVASTFVNVQQTGKFTWNEFIMTSIIAALFVMIPTAKPEPAPPKTTVGIGDNSQP